MAPTIVSGFDSRPGIEIARPVFSVAGKPDRANTRLGRPRAP